ncbi:N4BP2_2 [Sanghuangporus sanghuang]
MSDVQTLGQNPGASGDTNSPVRGADNTNDEDLSANTDNDGTVEAETVYMRSRLKEGHDLLAATQDKLEDIEKLLEPHAHTDKEVIDSLRQLGFTAFRVNKYAHDIAARRREMNAHYTDTDPHVAYAKIDLHNLHVDEAKEYVSKHLDKYQRSGLSQMEIICMPDVQILGQNPGASANTNSPVRGADNTHDEDLSANNTDEDGAVEAETVSICSRLKEGHDLLAATQDKLEDIEQLLEPHAHTDKEVIDSLCQLGFTASTVNKYAHDIAARCLFREMNPHYTDTDPHVAYAKIDLHRLHVDEAKEYVSKHLHKCQHSGLSQTEIICGWGKNSRGGAKIRPALIEEFQRTGVQYVEPSNRGRLIVCFNIPNTEDRAAGNDFDV